MSSYRLKPHPPAWRIGGVAAALLVLPTLLSLVTPRLDDGRSPVTLGAAGNPWENVIQWPEGGDLVCEEIGDPMLAAWDCDGTEIRTMIMEGSRDEENTLRRAMRALLNVEVGDGEWVRDEGILLYETADGIGISQEGTGDSRDQMMIAVVRGDKQRPYAAIIVHDMRGGKGALPDLSELGDEA